jgi:hypothetical protein
MLWNAASDLFCRRYSLPMPATATRTVYCTILAQNYLPKAVTLADSLRRHHPEAELVVLLIDVLRDEDLPDVPGVRVVSTEALGIPERQVLRLATIYNLVEFATAVKPLLFLQLLKDAEQAAYLDPDTYVTAPMVELPVDLAGTEGGILLTPHYLAPTGEDGELGEGHLLHVGVYNLGFCAVDRRAAAFLDWWWGHLEWECLWDPMAGLFVDQKWVDLGANFFAAGNWRHPGYNVSIANLHERPIASDDHGYYIASTGDRLRLFHFHAFDTSAPKELSTRFASSSEHLRAASTALDSLCVEYAEALIKHERTLPPAPAYPYFTDTRGRRISRQLRRAYRIESEGGADLPSPFVPAEADAFDAWRRGARRLMGRELVGDAMKSLRVALPEEYTRIKERVPGLAKRARSRFVRSGGIWGG